MGGGIGVQVVGQRQLGRELYGEADASELPLPDDLHPDAATHRRVGARFADLAFGPGGPFAVTG